MKVVNSWLGRSTALTLVMFLIATTCQASTLVNFIAAPEPPGIDSSRNSGVSFALSSQVADPAGSTPVQPQRTTSSTAISQTKPADPAQPQPSRLQPPQATTPATQNASPDAQTLPAPVVRSPASPPVDSRNAPMPPAAQPGQQATPGTNQPYTGDQQYSTPAATQQLNRRPLNGQPASAPASEPTALPVAPVGTAVAPSIRARGTAGSRVAGAAVAPAKQRRIRTFAIRAALVAGAAIAIGVVVAASKASPARAQ